MKRFAEVLVCLLVIGSLAYGQATATVQVSGTVTDASGAGVPRAEVSMTQVATGSTRATTTDQAGNYTLSSLPIGEQRLGVKVNGFKTYVQSDIVLQVNANPRINVVLQVGAVSEQVLVRADAAMIETENNAISEVVDQQRIVELPLNGRNAAQLTILAGAASARNSLPVNDIAGNSKQYPASVAISVAGGEGNGDNYIMDGADHNDAFSNVNLPVPFPDALQEFSLQTSVPPAQYGLHPGAVVNLVTKSGSNGFHGDLFEFLRNGDLNARNFFAAAQDTLRRNQFGGTFGGRIIRDKLFFFGGYQGTRTRTAPPTQLSFVPTAAVLQGDFSQYESGACQSNGKARTLTDPATGAPFPNNVIPTARFNQTALNVLKYVPVSTDPCGAIHYSVPSPNDEDQVIGRVDWISSSKNTFFGRYFISDYRNPTSYDGKNAIAKASYGLFDKAQSGTLGDTYVFSPRTINSLHFAITRLTINRQVVDNFFNPATIGQNVFAPLPNTFALSLTGRFSIFSNGGFFNNSSGQITDDLQLIRGRHQIGVGFDVIRNRFNEVGVLTADGRSDFNGQFTNDAMVDFLLGLPSDFMQSGFEAQGQRQLYLGFYGHDVYRVRRNFTINLGLRWEPYIPVSDIYHRGSYFDPAAFAAGTRSQVYTNAPPGLFFCGDKQTPCAYAYKRLNNFAPRLGLVWDPKGNGRMTVRAGYGIFRDTPEIFYFDHSVTEPPFGTAITVNSPAGGLTNPWQGYPGGSPYPIPFPPPSNFTFPPGGQYINNPLHIHPTYMQQWNLSISRQVGASWVFSASYLGNKTTHLWVGTEENPAVYIPGACNGSPCSTTANTNSRRVLALASPAGAVFGPMGLLDDGSNASYNGLLLSANHRFSQNFTVLVNYTWSHCISQSDFGAEIIAAEYQNPYNRAGDRGNCAFDHRQIFNASAVAMTPRFEGFWMRKAFSDWEVSTIVTRDTGIYFTPISGADYSLTAVGVDRPNVVGNPNINPQTIAQWFNTSAFAPNSPGTYGAAGRNSLLGPAFINVDAALMRNFRMRERYTLQVRGEFFNALNHANFNIPDRNLKDSVFARITTAADPRILQFALKLVF